MKVLLTILGLLFMKILLATESESFNLVVAKDGTGQFTTIQQAIESLPMYNYESVIIFIKNGVYEEKLRIERNFITLIGESRDSTLICYNQPRPEWDANPDVYGPGVVNIFADDIILQNLTIENTQPRKDIHAFAIYGKGTRTILLNCSVLSNGGDTVSLWNYESGMYYHSGCYFKGAVDFVCPRGWCYINNSTFFEVRNTAAVWHAAVENPKQKFVMEQCTFEGADSFYLARHHYEAQFYFLDCEFPSIMRDKRIAQVTYKDEPERDMPYFYGDRYYFYNCQRQKGNYSWFADNLKQWPSNITPDSITPAWTFDRQWDPEDSSALVPTKIEVLDSAIILYFSEKVMQKGSFAIRSSAGKIFRYESGSGRSMIRLIGEKASVSNEKQHAFSILQGQLITTAARIKPRIVKLE